MKYFVAISVCCCAVLAVILALEDQDKPACPIVCTKNLDPVCAQDSYGNNKTYPNECFIGYLNCKQGTSYKFFSQGECSDDPIIVKQDEEMDNAFQNDSD